jgi:transcription antitermination factor NusG
MRCGKRVRVPFLPGSRYKKLQKIAYLSERGEALPEANEPVLSSPAVDCKITSENLWSEHKAPHWRAIYTSPRHEKRAHEHLLYREVECFLPLYTAVHRWRNGCKVEVDLPLFPGYLFAKISASERVRVLDVPGVVSIVGRRADASTLSDLEIEKLRSGLHLQKFEPHSHLTIGEKVRIAAGPLSGLVGILLRTANSFRVVLTLDLIQQSVAVELDAADVEPLESESPRNHYPSRTSRQN